MRLTCVSLVGFAFLALISATEYYNDTFDNLDVDAILNSDRLLNQYTNCLFDKGPCTADGRTLKRILPDVVATVCEKCNPQQRELIKKIGNHLRSHKPETWMEFLRKFDPNGEYVTAYEKFLGS